MSNDCDTVTIAKGYFEDVDGNGCYDDLSTDNLVDTYKSRMVAGVSTHVKATGPILPLSKAAVDFSALYDYGDAATFATRVDNSIAGQMRDCAECHVGGGAMEYVPVAPGTNLAEGVCETNSVTADTCTGGTNDGLYCGNSSTLAACTDGGGTCTDDVEYTSPAGQVCGNADDVNDLDGDVYAAVPGDAGIDQGCGTYPNSRGTRGFHCESDDIRDDLRTANVSGYNAYGAFIDQYDEDGDLDTTEVLTQDFDVTGVLEMDCLICHLDGYAYEERREALRKGQFDASRVVGAHSGTAVTGTTVAYDPAMVQIDGDTLELGVSGGHIHGMPSENCANCHMDMHQVDWKKRGDSWGVPYTADVHGSLECVSCHSRKDAKAVETHAWRNYSDMTDFTGQANGLLGHDPAKANAPYSSLWNANDNTMKTCASCHIDGDSGNLGAVDPTAKHDALGLTAQVLQTGTTGVADASHLDVIDCMACHVRKLGHGPTEADGGTTHGSLYEWGTGGAMVDSTGRDADGRNTDHENLYVERTMEDNLTVGWQGGKITAKNSLVTMFWRDKNDTTVDINADGQAGGMDAVNSTHVGDAMDALGIPALTQDGTFDATEIADQRAALELYLPSVGIDPTGAALKLSFMGVTFKVQHNVSPAAYAFGKGGCLDCHADGAGFYNGDYEVKPRDLTLSYATTDAVPFTKVNAGTPSDYHPTLWAKASQGNGRSIALTIRNGAGGTTLRTVDKSEYLWESTLYAPITTTTDATVKNTRAEMVDYLNNVTGSTTVHSRHSGAGYGNCLNCHDDGAGAIDFASRSDAGPAVDKDGVTLSTFTYTDGALPGNPGTCSANSCHASWGFSDENIWQIASDVKVTPFLSALNSRDSNNSVSLNATRSSCDTGACVCTWDATTESLITGGSGTCAVVISNATPYTAVVTVTDPSGEQRSVSVDVDPQVVEDPQYAAGDVTVDDNEDGTCTVTSSAAGIGKAYIYWGNRTQTAVNPAELAAGVSDYCGSSVKLKIYDTKHIVTDLDIVPVVPVP